MFEILYNVLGGALVIWLAWPTGGKSMADEERELRAYFRRRDQAERRGELWPR